jgi:SAM-dependent methyltransferase
MSRQRARELASQFLASADPTGWFEALYAEAGSNHNAVPWADLAPNPNLVDWAVRENPIATEKTALTVGCGYGDDAEYLAKIGFEVVGFDLSPTAISECQRRFPNSQVSYQVGDLLNPPKSWVQKFDFVLESYTLQALTSDLRASAISNIASFVAPSGQLLIITRGREPTDPLGKMPYPLTKEELKPVENLGLKIQSFEDYFDREEPPARRFRVLYANSFLSCN